MLKIFSPRSPLVTFVGCQSAQSRQASSSVCSRLGMTITGVRRKLTTCSSAIGRPRMASSIFFGDSAGVALFAFLPPPANYSAYRLYARRQARRVSRPLQARGQNAWSEGQSRPSQFVVEAIFKPRTCITVDTVCSLMGSMFDDDRGERVDDRDAPHRPTASVSRCRDQSDVPRSSGVSLTSSSRRVVPTESAVKVQCSRCL
jgi:hypothetical protein